MKNNSSVTVPRRIPLLSDVSFTAVVAGLVAALVSYAGPFAVVLQAARSADLSAAQTTSWVWAVAVGSGISGIALSVCTRTPVVVAWSTPGAALLIGSLGGYGLSDVVGAFLLSSLAACLLGFTGWFGRVLALVPAPVLTALLAGVLLPFVMHGARAVAASPLVAGAVVLAFLLGKRYADRYSVALALVAGLAAAAFGGELHGARPSLDVAVPVWTTPTFDVTAVLAIGVPLFLVTMASQNAPGLTVLRAAGYRPDDRMLVGWVSLVSALLTPFGGHATNLAAITAAICTGPEAHRDPARRYVAGVVCGLANLLVGLFSGGLIGLFAALPDGLVTALAAVALLSSLLGAIGAAVSAPPAIALAALLTLAVTASGVVVAGIGSAFWGLLSGIVTWLVLTPRAAARPCGRRRPGRLGEVPGVLVPGRTVRRRDDSDGGPGVPAAPAEEQANSRTEP